MISEINGVHINPQHLFNKWGHMFHAHISNLNYAFEKIEYLDYVILMSSGDLFYKEGAPSHMTRHLFGCEHGPVDQGWSWVPAIRADTTFSTLRSAAGLSVIRSGLHEGTFFRREMAEWMVQKINSIIKDWEYDNNYPKEEVFFPTLAGAFLDAPSTRNMSRFLGADLASDRRAVAAVLLDVTQGAARDLPLLRDWIRENPPLIENEFYAVARIPRLLDNVLRRVLVAHSQRNGADAALAELHKLTPQDLLAFDFPARSNPDGKMSASVSRLLSPGTPAR